MKALILTAALIALAAPALAQQQQHYLSPAQPTNQDKVNAMQQILQQSDESRLKGFIQHDAATAMAFNRKRTQLPASSFNDIAPAAGPVPMSAKPVQMPQPQDSGVAMRSRVDPRVADPRDLPLMTGNIRR